MDQMIDAVQAANLLSNSTEQRLAFGFSLLCGIGQQAYCIQMIRKTPLAECCALVQALECARAYARLIDQ